MPEKEASLPLCIMQVGRFFIPVEPITNRTIAPSPKQRVVVFEKEGNEVLCAVRLPVGYDLPDHEPPGDVLTIFNYRAYKRQTRK